MAPAPPAPQILMLTLVLILLPSPPVVWANSPRWQWTCDSGLCVRSEAPPDPRLDAELEETVVQRSAHRLRPPWPSHELCRLTCGPYGALWPRPTGHTLLADALVPFSPATVRFDLSAVAGEQGKELADAASRRWVRDLQHALAGGGGHGGGGAGAGAAAGAGTDVLVTVLTRDRPQALSWETDETYTLDVASNGHEVRVTVSAQTVWGALHGLTSLRQLVGCCGEGGAAVLVAEARIADGPVYTHRGLLLDTARNFLPVGTMMATMDAMAASKLNVLHWHATDSQSFPLLLPRVPQLARWGAFSARETYSAQQVSALLSYARARGIRLLLELDAPAHSGQGWQWGEAAGLGALALCVGQQPWRRLCIQPPCGQLNPANPRLLGVLADVYRDVVDLWPPGQPLHMGGDEVSYSCWNSSAEVLEYMSKRRWDRSQDGFLRLWAEFQQAALEALDEARGSSDVPAILWSSHLTRPGNIERFLNSSRYVIETWVEGGDPLPQQLLALGYRLVVATKDAWYLDHGFWGSTRYHDWKAVYSNRLPGSMAQGVLGGEVASWGELVDDQSLDARVWPRAAALAERLWSNPGTSAREAEPRLHAHRARLVAAGVRAEALAPRYCVLNEGACH
ncbi:chitooligosaccharidolytic beta-N-acetylglucosaminidase-like [Schistocerca piceifrons]|uniref:chitooligosaccharidolytic beta-N-acetylglucosaminidase-like n=1 Tax=Schistocerca piceifrons TaxID=274613 RepID=UPI001F5ED66D|nr:chitooligosaccharidolytic beta-N-acetylglucosaminidase-like [Schistocerca piceifrons]